MLVYMLMYCCFRLHWVWPLICAYAHCSTSTGRLLCQLMDHTLHCGEFGYYCGVLFMCYADTECFHGLAYANTVYAQQRLACQAKPSRCHSPSALAAESQSKSLPQTQHLGCDRTGSGLSVCSRHSSFTLPRRHYQ